MRRISHTYFHTSIRFRPFFFYCGLLMAASEIWKQYCLTFLVNHGTYNWWYFPFQLCSTPMYILLFLPHIKKERLCNACLTFLMSFGLLGGIAVFADTTGLHYPLPALTIHSYTWHILLIVIGCFAAASLFSRTSNETIEGTSTLYSDADANASVPLCFADTVSSTLRGFKDATLLYIFFCITAACINHICSRFGTINMFYINSKYPMEQIVFCELVPYLGNIPVIFLYIAATILGAGILFFLWNLIYSRRNS